MTVALVCGGRDFDDAEFLWRALDRFHAKHPISILIEGGATGADRLARQWAGAHDIHVATVKAIWTPASTGGHVFDRGAGPKRNRAMRLLRPDAVIAFPGGSGTADMVAVAVDAGIDVWEPRYE